MKLRKEWGHGSVTELKERKGRSRVWRAHLLMRSRPWAQELRWVVANTTTPKEADTRDGQVQGTKAVPCVWASYLDSLTHSIRLAAAALEPCLQSHSRSRDRKGLSSKRQAEVLPRPSLARSGHMPFQWRLAETRGSQGVGLHGWEQHLQGTHLGCRVSDSDPSGQGPVHPSGL